jgi:hypothetical protein
VRPKSASQTDASFCGVDDGRPNSVVAAKIDGSGVFHPAPAVRCWDQFAADRSTAMTADDAHLATDPYRSAAV